MKTEFNESMQQLELFKSPKKSFKPIPKSVSKPEKPAVDLKAKYLSYLQHSDLWDMRAWNNYKDEAEVREYIKNPDNKNDGHAQYCIEQLKDMGVPEEEIYQAIMENQHITYKNRIAACMIDVNSCPKIVECKFNYSECHVHCKKCNGQK